MTSGELQAVWNGGTKGAGPHIASGATARGTCGNLLLTCHNVVCNHTTVI